MQVAGSVISSATGKIIPGVTVWELLPDARSANVLGYADNNGIFSVNVPDGSTVMFSAENYTSVNVQPYAVLEDSVIRLDPDSMATITAKIPAWVIVLVAFGLIFLTDKKKR